MFTLSKLLNSPQIGYDLVVIRALVIAAVFLSAALGAAPSAAAGGHYRNCKEAHQDGRYDIPQGDPDYWDGGDRDHDGIACES
jgi:hypothetical protein